MQASVQRRAVRRDVRTECQAVELAEFRLLGEQVLDLSPQGMLVRCERAPSIGDDVVVSFKAPGFEAPWLDAEAVVARLIRGFRSGDRGVCAGLDFTYFEKTARNELLARLAGFPPPIPQRRLRTAWDRARIVRDRRPQTARGLRGRDSTGATATHGSVAVHRILTLRDEPVFPLQRIRHAPRGVFRD